ncbi:ACT domain-containing protein [Halothiobacillus sp.]|uniref:glycine cleavage system protein R n=1 Tax=Halothiobacillus sp. TaxID=1891311 RepID=UPI0026105F16|nr:ACT domain-containing protein [Halothiobacillus sp.]
MQTQLIVNLFGPMDASHLADLLALIQQQQCRAQDSHMLSFEQCMAVALRICGNWDRVSRVDSALREFAERGGIDIQIQHEQAEPRREPVLPYVVDAIGLESADLAAVITRFLARQEAGIRELSTRAYRPARSSERLIELRAQIEIPARCHLGQLKSDFFDLCDTLNLDAAIEPERRP